MLFRLATESYWRRNIIDCLVQGARCLLLEMFVCGPLSLIVTFISISSLRRLDHRSFATPIHEMIASTTAQTQPTQSTDNEMSPVEQQLDHTQTIKRRSKDIANWTIRPATVYDRDGCAALIKLSYHTFLVKDYSHECLSKCLPLITTPREQLLTCNTWYVVEHPLTRQIVGCGGWTVRRPQTISDKKEDENDEACTKSGNGAETSPPARVQEVIVPHVRHFATHPDYARLGIASCIWQRILSDISKQFIAEGRPFPIIEVYSTLTAESFYSSCGFEVVDRIEVTLRKDTVFPAILMRRLPLL